jgi:hypothetical protein
MLLPEIEIKLARERIEEQLRQNQQYKEMIEMQRRAAKLDPNHKPEQRNWFRQLLLGKAGV